MTNDTVHWQAMVETGAEYGNEVSSFLLAMADTRPLYNTHDANRIWRRGELFIWLGQRMLARARIDAKP